MKGEEGMDVNKKRVEEVIFCDMSPWRKRERGRCKRKVDVDIGQTRPADNQTDSDALPISARNLDRPHCGTVEENVEKASYEWQGVTGCHSCDEHVFIL